MNDDGRKILNNSKRRLTRLKLLSNYFENISLISIYIKTEIIHNLFKDNPELEYNKLELFHLQYTDSLIDLLTKIKKKKETEALGILSEINANQNFIERYNNTVLENNFEVERKFYSSTFSIFIKTIYDNLVEHTTNNMLPEVFSFNEKYANEYYRNQGEEVNLQYSDDKKFYNFNNYNIERKLLGRLNIQSFKVRFICGFLINNHIYEVFRIFVSDDYFCFNVQTKEIYFLDDNQTDDLDLTTNTSNRLSIATQLKQKNAELEYRLEANKSKLSTDVVSVLEDYKNNLENINVLNNILKIDEETNVLRAMLNLNLNND